MAISALPLVPTFSSSPHSIEGYTRQFSARSFLPLSTQTLWQIKTGCVRTITWLEDGTIVVLGIGGPGDIVGAALMQGNGYQLECVTKVQVAPIAAENLANYSEVLISHLHQAEQLLQIRSHKRVEVTLLKFLNWLAQRFGQEIEHGRLIDLRLTHADIAETIGATRVTVTRLLNQLKQQGTIDCLSLRRIIVREEEIWHYEI